MTEAAAQQESPRKASKLPLLVGAVLGVAAALAGYLAVGKGLLGGQAEMAGAEPEQAAPVAPVSFVMLEPLMVSLGPGAPGDHLRFEGHLEVAPRHQAEVEALMPRIMDVLNSYLRAVETSDLRDPAALIRLRAQMLRRIQVVTGEGRVNDLLITQFLIS